MHYRKFSNLDFEVSASGCGALRLPALNSHGAAIDELEAPQITKRPSRKIESVRDFDKYFNEQLAKLQTNHVDFYLPYSNSGWWCKLRDLGVLDWAEKAIARIDRLVFSFRDGYETFKEVVNGYGKWVLYLNTADK
jgi:predicted aldo/keto reductase-like oxidoreductase